MKSATKRDLAIFELNEEISLFNPTTLKVTETTVRNTLPSAEGKSRFFNFRKLPYIKNISFEISSSGVLNERLNVFFYLK